MNMSPRQQELLSHPRWAQVAHVITWYRDLLTAADGCTQAEITAIEKHLGLPLPTVMREWFELLGHRLRSVQDWPSAPRKLWVKDNLVQVWGWHGGGPLYAPPGEDPIGCFPHGTSSAPAPISVWLTGLLMSETLIGVVSGSGTGSLGAFHAEVHGGGLLTNISIEEWDALQSHYPPLEWPLPTVDFPPSEDFGWDDWDDRGRDPFKPFWRRMDEPYTPTVATWHGDADTIIRFLDGEFVEWTTRTRGAAERLGHVLDLEAEGTEVVVQLSPISGEEQARRLRRGSRMLDETRFFGSEATLAAVKDLSQVDYSSSCPGPSGYMELHLITPSPKALCDLLVAALVPIWGDLLTVALQPVRGGRFTVVHPPGVNHFVTH
ncbi:hypothetical protein [Tessaracoccus sp. OH4464_COT-324]|uniref:hypothetical protein n=1 Tax=Tessaracoccus sp. OH4464_COT-324 TaxID=2491059 RepID=UPI000F634D9A|nr:hypothetical protein [Tessaracoccus sp. OH4464_COT-324]RRD47779.1 hypothetical protein EII42_00550 [Tessaracoccus sp. OH4464_COT-324]